MFETGNPFREFAEVTHTLPPACVYHSCSGWLLIIGNLRLCRFLTGNLGLLFPTKLVTSVGVDNVYKGRDLYMCSLFSVSDYDMGVGLDRH